MDADMIAATVMAADTSVGIAGKAALYAVAFDATDAWNAFADE